MLLQPRFTKGNYILKNFGLGFRVNRYTKLIVKIHGFISEKLMFFRMLFLEVYKTILFKKGFFLIKMKAGVID
jgi:hypothetical protein